MSMPSAIFRQWNFPEGITSLTVTRNGEWVMAALATGIAKIMPASGEAEAAEELSVHEGVFLSVAKDADTHCFLSGGDDGRVTLIDPLRHETTLLAQHKGQWVDHVAASADGKHRAYSVGKKTYVLDDEGKFKFPEPLQLPSSPGGLAFSPNNKRLAVSHYNGLSLFWLNAKDITPTVLSWKGSHLEVIWTPEGKSVLTSMQENALHGWQLSDQKEMRMQGYASKVRSMDFTVKGKFLATSGADQIICWPFSGGGPWGKPPLTLGGSDQRLVTQVACHPRDEMIAAGYSDGMVILAPLDGRMEIMINMPNSAPKATINGLVWNSTGEALFASSESGTLLLFTIESVRKALVQH
jgi:WD40 repeat protein